MKKNRSNLIWFRSIHRGRTARPEGIRALKENGVAGGKSSPAM
jgi:hypothetical protein